VSTPITLTPVGGPSYSIVSARLLHFFKGAWIVDAEIASASLQRFGMPAGKVVIVLGGIPMTGTIDPGSSGVFGPTARARIVAGGGGWDQAVAAQDWHFDSGVLSTTVYQATGALVGEVVVDELPTAFNIDFVRGGLDAASAVFRDNLWWLDTTGITHVGVRPPGIPDTSLVIRDFDPVAQRVTFSCESLLLPNTPLVDARFKGVGPTVYDVEQVFDGEGSIGWAWSAPKASSPLLEDLKSAVLHFSRATFLRQYRYRLVVYQGTAPTGGPERMALQAVTPTAGVPDVLPLTPWSGLAGAVAELSPSQEVLVVFENADPTLPRVVSYSPLGIPQAITIDAVREIDIGPSVQESLKLAGGGAAVAREGDTVKIAGLLVVAPAGTAGGPCTISVGNPPGPGVTDVTGTIVSGSLKVQAG
jgi:hypothetical protein